MVGSPDRHARTGNYDLSPQTRRRSRSRERSHDGYKRQGLNSDYYRDRRESKREQVSSNSRRKMEDVHPPRNSRRRRSRSDSLEDDSPERDREHHVESRSDSRSRYRHRHKDNSHRSRSRSPRRGGRSTHRAGSPSSKRRQPLPSQEQSYRGTDTTQNALDKPQEKEKPNFRPTGLLAAESNKVTIDSGSGKNAKSIVLKYNEPPEARKPPSSQPWLLYIFKGASKDPIETVPLHSRSCWLMGREVAVADIPTEHPSCSKQHAVFQFRYITKKDEYGERKGKVGLYLIDLESNNGTFLNGERIEQARYFECLGGDVIKLGESEREYVLLLPSKQ